MHRDLKLLDCTLRDGGYINDWRWGFLSARNVIRALVRARVDVVEVGFLRNVDSYDADITVCNRIEELNKLLPEEHCRTMFSAMAMNSNYDVGKLSSYCGSGIEMIRVTAHDYDLHEGLAFAAKVKEKGYKLSINPINIMGYTDEQILGIVDRVNEIQPYQFSIVDTFGSMKRRDLERIVGLVDNNLSNSIRLALHLHENMSLCTCLAQNFVDMHLKRPVSIDASLMGMGRVPGNLPIELIADYLNDYDDKSYDLDPIMDAIEDYIMPLKGSTKWGYTPAYFLSARFNLHRNYAEHYINKGDLTNQDINHILARIDQEKKTAFDVEYADKLYNDYKDNIIDDHEAREKLKCVLKGRAVLVMAPGATIKTHGDIIDNFIANNNPIVISVNFVPGSFHIDYAFFGNKRRLNSQKIENSKLIVTSNVTDTAADIVIDYNSLCGAIDQGYNSLIMILKLLEDVSDKKVYIAGADGYRPSDNNYYDTSFRSRTEHGTKFNDAVREAINKFDLDITFITPSAYDRHDS